MVVNLATEGKCLKLASVSCQLPEVEQSKVTSQQAQGDVKSNQVRQDDQTFRSHDELGFVVSRRVWLAQNLPEKGL